MSVTKFLAGLAASFLMMTSAGVAQTKLAPFKAFDSTSVTTLDHEAWAQFLSTYLETTEDNRTVIAYGEVTKGDHDALKRYLKSLQDVDPTTLNRDEAFAYWVNLYNGLTVDIILDKYPVSSIFKIFSGIRPGPWKRNLARVNGVKLSLDNIEHGMLRPFWSDNRVHYAVNCASYGCPNLATVPFTSANLDALLDEGARAYVNHPRGVSVIDGSATASSIYKWFREDFGDNDAGVIAHLKLYAEPALKEQLESISKIDRYDYDWSLNEPANPQ